MAIQSPEWTHSWHTVSHTHIIKSLDQVLENKGVGLNTKRRLEF